MKWGDVMNLIKEKREEVGLTQKELAEKVNKSLRTIQAIEQGRRKPGRVLTLKLFKLLKIPISQIKIFLE